MQFTSRCRDTQQDQESNIKLNSSLSFLVPGHSMFRVGSVSRTVAIRKSTVYAFQATVPRRTYSKKEKVPEDSKAIFTEGVAQISKDELTSKTW